jgi:hypothetical protein
MNRSGRDGAADPLHLVGRTASSVDYQDIVQRTRREPGQCAPSYPRAAAPSHFRHEQFGPRVDRRRQVDLGTTYPVREVDLLWEASYAKSYKIKVSTNGTTWADAHTQTNSSGGTERIPLSAQARYVRMQGVALSGQWGYSLYERQVYG